MDTDTNSNTKWATFTYSSPHVRKITNFFKHTNLKIAFKCNNTISQLTKAKTHNNAAAYDKSGIYKLTCNTCKPSYVVQTRWSLKLWYQEHWR
jgi:chromosome condensin MukBEF complex kleisin-like MukF subunit